MLRLLKSYQATRIEPVGPHIHPGIYTISRHAIMDRLAGLREARPLVQCNSITALPLISASEDSGPTMILRLTDY
jgi:hypothetical protein